MPLGASRHHLQHLLVVSSAINEHAALTFVRLLIQSASNKLLENQMNSKRFYSFKHWPRAVSVLSKMAAVALYTWAPLGHAQAFAAYSEFQGMSLSQLTTLQVKLTYVGPQIEPISTLAFTSTGSTLDLSKFVPFRHSGINYSNDDGAPIVTFPATTAELKSVIDGVGTLSGVTSGGVATIPFLSFALFNSEPGIKGFEAVLNQADATALFAKLRVSLANNKSGLRRLSELACPLDLLQTERPADVSPSAKIVLSGVRLNRTTRRYVGSVTVTNTSAAAILAPISLVIIPANNVRLANADGTTCGTGPVGATYIDLPGTLNPGKNAVLPLDFENPDRDQVKVTTLLLAGPGAR